MAKYTRNPNIDDFLSWLNQDQSTDSTQHTFYYEEILPTLLDLEMDDYFGTEGFDKRFG